MNTWSFLSRSVSTLILISLVSSQILPTQAVVLFQDDAFGDIRSATLRLGSNDVGAADTAIQFGADGTGTENGVISWNISSNTFSLDHTVSVTGGLSATGAVNFSGASQTRLRESANPTTSAACANTGEVIMNTTSNRIEICTVTGGAGAATWVVAPAGDANTLDGIDSASFLRSDTSDSYTSGTLTFDAGTTLTNNGTTNINGVATIGDNGDAITVNSNTWDISSAGVGSGFTGFSSSGTLTSSGNLSVTGTGTIGDGGDAISVNTNTWDVSTAGVGSGFTGMTSTGAINYSGATYRGPEGSADPGTCTVGEYFYNTTSNLLKICTATNTFSPLLRTDTSQAFTAGTYTFNSGTTLTGNGAINFTAATSFRPPQGAADPGTCSVGQEFYNTTSNAMKVCTATNTWTIAVSPNGADLLDGVDSTSFLRSDTSDNFTSGTLTTDNGTTFTVNGIGNLGDGGDAITVNSNTWDISGAGVGSSFTGFASSGVVNFFNSSSFRIREVTDEATAACTTVKEIVVDTTENRFYICTVVGSPGTWVAPAGAADDFEAVYGADADDTLTTSNGNFTVAAGSGAVNINATTGGVSVNTSVNGAINLATGTSTGTVTLGGTGTQTIAVGNGAGVKTVNVGSSNTTSTTTLLSGSGGVLINDANNQPTSIGTGTSTGTVTLGGTGTQTIAVGNGAGVKTVNVGSSNTTSTTTILSGSGAVNINASNNQPTNIATGTTTGTVTIGGTGTQTIAVGNGAGVKTVQLGSNNTTSTTTILGGSGNVQINDGNGTVTTNIGTGTTTGAVTLGGTGTQTIAVGNGAGVKTVNLGSTNTTSTTNISSGSGAVNINASNNQATNIGTGTTTGTVTIGGTGTQTIAVGNGAGVKTVNVGSSNTTSATTISSGTGNISLQAASTATGNIQIGAGAASATPDLLILDNKNTASDPTGTAGALYYNSNMGKFRCFEAAWFDCIRNPVVSSVVDATVTSPTPGTAPTYGTEIELLNPTRPSITPDNTSQRVLITGAVQYTNPLGGDDTEAGIVVRIRRGSGSCAGTQVGADITTGFSDPIQSYLLPFFLVDSPATASAQEYTVCAALRDTNGATATNATTPNVSIILQQVAP